MAARPFTFREAIGEATIKITISDRDRAHLAARMAAAKVKGGAVVEPTPAERKRLREAHASFVAKLQSHPPEKQRAIINATAAGMNEADSFTRAVATKMRDIHRINDKITGLAAELKEIEGTDLSGYRPADPGFKGRMLARADELREQIGTEQARALGIAEEDLSRAQSKAIEQWRQEEADATKARAILAEADRLTKAAEENAIRKAALAIANGRRADEGKPPIPDGDA